MTTTRKSSLDLTKITRLSSCIPQSGTASIRKHQPNASSKASSQTIIDVRKSAASEEDDHSLSSVSTSDDKPSTMTAPLDNRNSQSVDSTNKGKRPVDEPEMVVKEALKRPKVVIEGSEGLNFVVGEPITGSGLDEAFDDDNEQGINPVVKSTTTKEILADYEMSPFCLSCSSTGSRDDDSNEVVREDSSIDIIHNFSSKSKPESTLLPVVSTENVTDLSDPPVEVGASSVAINCGLSSSTNTHREKRVVGLVVEHGAKHFHTRQRFFPERPQRIQAILDHLESSEVDLLNKCATVDTNDTKESKEFSQAEAFLNDNDFLRVHLPGYMSRLTMLGRCKCQNRLDGEASQYTSIYLTPDSIQQAKQAASSLCQLVENVMNGKQENGFAIIRPPGHHAEPGTMGGFCIINNIAVAAAYAKAKLGASKIMIVDWDVHHGNGTQKMFLNDPNVLYFSVHRYDGASFFPHTKAGAPSQVGEGAGEGYNVNVGWSSRRGGMGDAEYVAVWHSLLLPIARQFQPDLILISAGFDAAQGDLGECCITPECFAALTKPLLDLPSAKGRVVCALEGGYNRKVLSSCVEHVLKALLGQDHHQESSLFSSTEEFESTVGHSLLCNFAEKKLGMAGFTPLTSTEKVLELIQPTAAADIRQTISFHSEKWNL